MVTREDIEKYEIYLRFVDKQVGKFFKEQAPYIFCKEGCSHCCETGEYPFSEIEFAYLMIGVQTLPPETISEIEKNMLKVKQEKENHKSDKPFMHACPFLVNKRCSLYNYRGIICRTHGLAFFSKSNKLLVPACVNFGLNYSNVYDFEKDTISDEKFKASGIEQEPLAHNVGLAFMMENDLTKKLELDFGELKPMCHWFLAE